MIRRRPAPAPAWQSRLPRHAADALFSSRPGKCGHSSPLSLSCLSLSVCRLFSRFKSCPLLGCRTALCCAPAIARSVAPTRTCSIAPLSVRAREHFAVCGAAGPICTAPMQQTHNNMIERAADLAFKQMEAGRTRWRFTSDAARMASIAAAYAQTSNSRLCCANADDLFVDEQLAAKYFGRGGSQWVYGELTLDGCLTMLNALLVRGTSESSIFLDVGSGVGQVVLSAALLGGVSQSIGVEIVPARHAVAERALAELASNESFVQHRVILSCSDILAESSLISDVSHVFIANAVWNDELTAQVVLHVAEQCPHICAIATLNAPPSDALRAAGLQHHCTLPVAVSWDREGWPLQVYHLSRANSQS